MKEIKALLPSFLKREEEEKRAYKPERFNLGYETDGLKPCVDAAHKAVQWWLNDIVHHEEKRSRWVTLFGKSGCGKTHLVEAARIHLKQLLPPSEVQRHDWTRLSERLMSGELPGLMEQLQNMPVLLLDDIGGELIESARANSVFSKLLYQLLNARLGKWTLLTTNLAPDQFPDARIASRLFRGLNIIVDMREAEDYSLKRFRKGAIK